MHHPSGLLFWNRPFLSYVAREAKPEIVYADTEMRIYGTQILTRAGQIVVYATLYPDDIERSKLYICGPDPHRVNPDPSWPPPWMRSSEGPRLYQEWEEIPDEWVRGTLQFAFLWFALEMDLVLPPTYAVQLLAIEAASKGHHSYWELAVGLAMIAPLYSWSAGAGTYFTGMLPYKLGEGDMKMFAFRPQALFPESRKILIPETPKGLKKEEYQPPAILGRSERLEDPPEWLLGYGEEG